MVDVLVVLVTLVTLVTLGVGALGAVRIRKDRPSLKSYERADMGSDSARTAGAKTDAPESLEPTGASHMRAYEEQDPVRAAAMPWLVQRVAEMVWQLTGIPLLAGAATPPPTFSASTTTMGNTAAPTRSLLSTTETHHSRAEVDALRDSKTTARLDADSQRPWIDAEPDRSALVSSEEEDDVHEEEHSTTRALPMEELRAHIMLDGLQFYSAVARVSVATVAHAVDIALFRATTIVLRERRKAHEDASIQAIETLYPDIMCLPSHASARYTHGCPPKDLKELLAATRSPSHGLSPRRQLETDFLKAA